MQISTKGRLALQMMLDLALHGGSGYVSLQEIAVRQGVAIKYLEQIAAVLARAGYVQSARGKTGGYRLSRPPREYRVGDILRALEGDLTPVHPGEAAAAPDAQTAAALEMFWADFARAIVRFVDGRTLEDLMDACVALNGGDYSI